MESMESPNPAMLEALRRLAGAGGLLSYEDYCDAALFHPELGYYRKDRLRVGRSGEADFYTASSLGGGVFATLACAAAESLLGGPEELKRHVWVEIGAEPGLSIFEQHRSRFSDLITIRLGEPIAVKGRAVVFANELFDAQPFRRLSYRAGAWCEMGVRITGDGIAGEAILPEIHASLSSCLEWLPSEWQEGFTLDVSPAAERLMDSIVEGDWTGGVIFPDYGKTFAELLLQNPSGTARSYSKHRLSADLFTAPGDRDITHHVAWDALLARLVSAGFSAGTPERQEAFFMRHASGVIEAIFREASSRVGLSRVGALRELLHPAHLGAKFQVLYGTRRLSTNR